MQAARAKTEFLGKMSHELRSPLNAIIGFSELSAQESFGPLSEHYLSYFTDIRSAAQHLLSIINNILDAVSIESSSIAVNPVPLRTAMVIDEARSLVALRAQQQGIKFEPLAVPQHLMLFADPVRTRQIFVNLLNNAVKFTPEGGRVGVETRRTEADALDITVWDTGVGIASDQQDLIFESFHHVGADPLTVPQESTGLGLTVSRQLARMMDGDIFVESTPGKGSRFTGRLPLAAESLAE